MFERYTEKARRVIFFARYEASQFGSPYIETEHLLLGILREDKGLTNRFLRTHVSVEAIRKQIEKQTKMREKIATTVDLPLSAEAKLVLGYAAEESERLAHKHIGNEHLLLGLLREEKGLGGKILRGRGLSAKDVREELQKAPHIPDMPPRGVEPAGGGDPFRDLTQAAMEGTLEPVAGREAEIASVIEILGCRGKRNAMLLGERGVGKTAVVEGLAQRIAEGAVPAALADKRVMVVEPEMLAERSQAELWRFLSGRLNPSLAIVVLDGLGGLGLTGKQAGASGVLRYALAQGEMLSVATATAEEYRAAVAAMPWLEECFREVHVRPLEAESTLQVLAARKGGLEKFHGVTYAAEAVEFAARNAGGPLPAKALELLDAAGALVKLRQASPSAEIAEVQQRIQFIVMRMENAIANHEFEKGRFYSDEERKEREKLRALAAEAGEPQAFVVLREDVEEVVARWGKYPYCP